MDTLGLINAKTRQAYYQAAEKYHNLFHDEMKEKAYDRKLLDTFGDKFAPGSLICDAGCGPSAHIGGYLFDKGLKVIGIDISDRCVELAARFNSGQISRPAHPRSDEHGTEIRLRQRDDHELILKESAP